MADEAPLPPAPAPPATQILYGRDGQAREVANADVPDAIRSGEFGFAQDAPVLIADADGKPRTVTGATAADLFTSARGVGTHVITKDAADAEIEREVLESPLGLAHSAGAGLARGLTLGLSDQAIANGLVPFTDADSQRHILEASKRINPGTSLAGEAGGLLLSALPTGGESLLAKGGAGALRAGGVLEGVTAIPRGVAALGRGAERFAVEAAQGAGLAREGVLAKAIGTAAQGAAEGTVFGIGQELSDAALHDRELTTESVLASGAHGAILGGVGGAGLSLLGSAGRAVGRKGYDTIEGLFTRATPEAELGAAKAIEAGVAPKLTDKTAEGYIRAIAGDDAGEAAALRDAWKRRSSLTHDSEAILEDSQRAIRRDVDELLETERSLTQEAQGKLKRSHVEDSIRTGNEEAVTDFAGNTTATLRKEIGEMLADPGAYGQVANLKTALKTLDHVEGEIVGAVGTPASNAASFVELDWLKRRLGKFAKPGQFLGADSATAGRFREMYEGLRGALENEDLWGKAATQQSEINAAWTKQLGSKDLFQGRFATKVGRDEIDPWLDKFGVDPTKVAGYVNGFGGAANDLAHETITKHVANTKALVHTIGKAYEVQPGQLEKASQAVERFEGTLAKVEDEVGAVSRLRKLKEAEGEGLGGAAGIVTDIATRPVASLARLAHVEAAVANVKKRIGEGVASFLEGAKAKLPGLPTHFPGVGAIIPKLEDRHAGKSREEEFEHRRTEIASFLANPEPQLAAAASLPAALHGDVSADAVRRAQYVASKLPAQAINPLYPKAKPLPVSPAEQAKWLRIANVVEKPLAIFDAIKAGQLSQEAVDALKATSPKIYAEIQKTVLAQLARMPNQPSYQKRVVLGTLLDIPTDPSLDPAQMNDVQTTFAPSPSSGGGVPAPSNRKPLALANEFKTKSQQEVGP